MNFDMGRQKNITVDYLKAIACITVVLQHCLSYLLNSRFAYFALFTELYNYSSKINVPLFFIISGYLLHQQPVGNFYRKKIPKLAVPFFVFSGLKILYSVFISGEFAHGSSVKSQLFDAFAVGELYWFSYSILIMFLMAPLIWKTKLITCKNKKCELPVIAITCFIALIIFNTVNNEYSLLPLPTVFQIKRTVTMLPFFLAGYIWSKIYPVIGRIKKSTAAVLLILSLPILLLARSITAFGYFVSTFVSIILCMDIWFLVKPFKKIPYIFQTISKYTYQVFFIDSFAKVIIFYMIEKLFGMEIYQKFTVCILIILFEVPVNIFASCVISAFAEKIPIVNVLFGLKKTKQSSKK